MAGFKHVLAATDGTEYGKRAVDTGSAIAKRAGSVFDVVTVADASLPTQPLRAAGEPTDWSEFAEGHLRGLAEAQIEAAGAGEATLHTAKGRAASAINETAEAVGADLLVLGGHHKPALSRFLLGSTSEKVARLASVPLLIAVDSIFRPFQRVLAAVDASHQSRAVLDVAATFGTMDEASMRALYVWEPMDPFVVPYHSLGGVLPVGVVDSRAIVEARHREAHEQFQERVAEANEAHSVELEARLREGHAGDEIVNEADEWDADLVVMGTHGAGFFDRMMMGSRSLHVLRHIERTTVLVPTKD